MKNRDELAEAFAVAIVTSSGPDGELWWEDAMRDAFNAADTFVAERERRAGTPAEPDAPTGGGVDVMCATPGGDPSDCERPAIHVDVSPSGDMRVPCCGRASCCIKPDNRWTIAPLAPEKPPTTAPVAPHDPGRGCAGCEHFSPETVTTWAFCKSRPDLNAHFETGHYDPSTPAPAWCPKRAKPGALRFNKPGRLVNLDDDAFSLYREGFCADVGAGFASIHIRATDRAHAERIVAAMLPVGRGTP